MTEHTLFESETETNRRAAATLLRDLADGVDAGQIQFSEGEESVTVEVASTLEVEIEAERETDDEDEEAAAEMEVEVELEWEEADGTGEAEAAIPDGESDGDAEEGESPATETDASEAESADAEADEEAEAETGDGEDEPTDAGAVGPDASVAAVMPGEDAPLASLGTFQVYRDRADEWRWRLVHRNGNVIASSGEGYTTRRNAEKGMRSVMRNAPGAEVKRGE